MIKLKQPFFLGGNIMAEYKRKFLAYFLCFTTFSSTIIFSGFAHAAGISMQGYSSSSAAVPYTQAEDEPRFFGMIGDLVIARPLLVAATILGTGIFVASLPFSAIGGNVKEAANTLVVGPARQTFVRCLGCSFIRSDSPADKASAPTEDPAK